MTCSELVLLFEAGLYATKVGKTVGSPGTNLAGSSNLADCLPHKLVRNLVMWRHFVKISFLGPGPFFTFY